MTRIPTNSNFRAGLVWIKHSILMRDIQGRLPLISLRSRTRHCLQCSHLIKREACLILAIRTQELTNFQSRNWHCKTTWKIPFWMSNSNLNLARITIPLVKGIPCFRNLISLTSNMLLKLLMQSNKTSVQPPSNCHKNRHKVQFCNLIWLLS